MAQFAVCHVSKGKGSSTGLTKHNERKVTPKNVNPKLTNQNIHKDYSSLGKSFGTRADQVIKNSGITRKIRNDAVKFNPVIISGSHEQMKEIQEKGQLKQWTNSVYEFVKEEFGEENIIGFDMHADEKTPHIHAVVVPIVKANIAEEYEHERKIKRKKKKTPEPVRLSSKILFSPERLVKLQDKVGLLMKEWGFQRGLKGSIAKHTTVKQYYSIMNNPVLAEFPVEEKSNLFKKSTYSIDKETLDAIITSSKGVRKENQQLKDDFIAWKAHTEEIRQQAARYLKKAEQLEKRPFSPEGIKELNSQLKEKGVDFRVKLNGNIYKPQKEDINKILGKDRGKDKGFTPSL